ncbi:MAG: hypothetical protein HC810_01685 [Acaryochloridaceae cyanobacterium RL_2_7]|nr:hypothetical protein [Acaryochloridaceae cyanobacterium RL_2_7]
MNSFYLSHNILQRERDQFTNLRESRAQLLVSQIQAQQLDASVQEAEEGDRTSGDASVLRLIERSLDQDEFLAGVSLYDREGKLLQSFEEKHELSDALLQKDQATSDLYRAQERLDIFFPSERFQGEFRLVLRYSTSHIRAMMVDFSLRKLRSGHCGGGLC